LGALPNASPSARCLPRTHDESTVFDSRAGPLLAALPNQPSGSGDVGGSRPSSARSTRTRPTAAPAGCPPRAACTQQLGPRETPDNHGRNSTAGCEGPGVQPPPRRVQSVGLRRGTFRRQASPPIPDIPGRRALSDAQLGGSTLRLPLLLLGLWIHGEQSIGRGTPVDLGCLRLE
jgi:hypothetical protein